MTFAKVGAVSYVIWGLLHVYAAYDGFMLGASLDPGLVQAKINQGAWDLLFISLASITVAIVWNWKNNPLGYWINVVMVSIADIGFIILVLIPKHVAFFPAILGPVFWILAVVFSTIAYKKRKNFNEQV